MAVQADRHRGPPRSVSFADVAPRVRVLALLAGAGAIVGGVHCVFDCTLQGCVGGFDWTASADDGTDIEPGTYRFETRRVEPRRAGRVVSRLHGRRQ